MFLRNESRTFTTGSSNIIISAADQIQDFATPIDHSKYLNDGIEHDLELGGSLRNPREVRDRLDVAQLRELGFLEQVQTHDFGLVGQHLNRNRSEHGTGSGTRYTDGHAEIRLKLMIELVIY